MKLIIKLNMNSDAFVTNDRPNTEAARILRVVAGMMDRNNALEPGNDLALFDGDGNEVGFLTVAEDDKVWSV